MQEYELRNNVNTSAFLVPNSVGDADFPTQSRLSNIANVDHELLHFRRYMTKKMHSVHPSAANYVFDDQNGRIVGIPVRLAI